MFPETLGLLLLGQEVSLHTPAQGVGVGSSFWEQGPFCLMPLTKKLGT